MKIPLFSSLWTLNAEKTELEPGIESILDIKGENSFLRRVVLLLALVALAQTAALLIKAPSPRSAALEPGVDEVRYGEEVQRSSQTAISMAASSSTSASSLTVANPPPEISATPPALVGQAAKPAPVPQATAAPEAKQGKTEASFWDLLNRVQNDPDREILDRTFSANGLAVHLEEICKAGILHFELENTSQHIVYLPKLSVPGKKVRVYLERQVLEPDTIQQGILVLDDPKTTGSVDAVVAAANVSPFKARIAIPKWR